MLLREDSQNPREKITIITSQNNFEVFSFLYSVQVVVDRVTPDLIKKSKEFLEDPTLYPGELFYLPPY